MASLELAQPAEPVPVLDNNRPAAHAKTEQREFVPLELPDPNSAITEHSPHVLRHDFVASAVPLETHVDPNTNNNPVSVSAVSIVLIQQPTEKCNPDCLPQSSAAVAGAAENPAPFMDPAQPSAREEHNRSGEVGSESRSQRMSNIYRMEPPHANSGENKHYFTQRDAEAFPEGKFLTSRGKGNAAVDRAVLVRGSQIFMLEYVGQKEQEENAAEANISAEAVQIKEINSNLKPASNIAYLTQEDLAISDPVQLQASVIQNVAVPSDALAPKPESARKVSPPAEVLALTLNRLEPEEPQRPAEPSPSAFRFQIGETRPPSLSVSVKGTKAAFQAQQAPPEPRMTGDAKLVLGEILQLDCDGDLSRSMRDVNAGDFMCVGRVTRCPVRCTRTAEPGGR